MQSAVRLCNSKLNSQSSPDFSSSHTRNTCTHGGQTYLRLICFLAGGFGNASGILFLITTPADVEKFKIAPYREYIALMSQDMFQQ